MGVNASCPLFCRLPVCGMPGWPRKHSCYLRLFGVHYLNFKKAALLWDFIRSGNPSNLEEDKSENTGARSTKKLSAICRRRG